MGSKRRFHTEEGAKPRIQGATDKCSVLARNFTSVKLCAQNSSLNFITIINLSYSSCYFIILYRKHSQKVKHIKGARVLLRASSIYIIQVLLYCKFCTSDILEDLSSVLKQKFRPLTVQAQARFHVSLQGICGGQIGSATETSVFLLGIIPLMLYT